MLLRTSLLFLLSTVFQSSRAFTFQASSSRPSLLAPTRLMATAGLSQDELKKMVGYKAVDDHVKSGMVVGLGTGSTAYFAVERVGQKVSVCG